MRQVLELCARMDGTAEQIYSTIAERFEDRSLSDLFERLSADEAERVQWWGELTEAWDQGLLPDVWPDTDEMRTQMELALAAMRRLVPAPDAPLTPSDALKIAATTEFHLLDPASGELIDLAEPATAATRHAASERHVELVAEALERYSDDEPLGVLLSSMLRRAWKQNMMLARLATRDALTGLGNRRAFTTQLRQWLAFACRYGSPLTVVLVDLDRFKDVNDLHGHYVGDDVLRQVAAALGTVTRGSDIIARYGGDEFAVLAPETGPEEARGLAERILEAVRGVVISLPDGSSVRPTVSLGSAVMLEPAESEARRPDELLAAADQGLYAAKQAGRDRSSDPAVLKALAV